MTTATLEKDQKIVEVLEKTMKLYRLAIEMDYEEQQRLILKYLRIVGSIHKELVCVKEACDMVLEKYPKGMPHDSTLIQEAMKLVKQPYRQIFPQTSFDEEMIIYKIYDLEIKELFDSIPINELEREEQVILKNLWRSVHNTLVENPNFKGENPYYKRNYHEMERAKKLWLELLDNDFNAFIEYFQEE
jgi:hypothetical protein